MADPAEELEVLFPDVDLEVRDPDTGEAVALTVREFRFLEGLRAQALARPFVEALAELIGTGEVSEVGADAVAGLMADHAETWLALAARACERPFEWVARLSDADGDALSDAMWSANAGFFMRRVVASVAAREPRESASRSAQSSTSSSAPATDADTTTLPAA